MMSHGGISQLSPRMRSRSRSRDRDEHSGYDPYAAHHRSVPQMTSPVLPNVLLSAQQAAQDKINRELFVGNTPPGTSEMLLLQFLNGAMRRVKLCQAHETPILNCRVNTKFAFIELVNAQVANKALSLNGIPFLGAILKVNRPSKYVGPQVVAPSWQQLTNQTLPNGAFLDAEQEKVNRELFIGNTTPEMTEGMLREFLGNAMEQVGLTLAPGNPIATCRVSGKFAFIELRSPEETKNALNLNNIPFMGAQLRVGRPSKWNGPPDTHDNWEDILAKYMSGELQLNKNAAGGGLPPSTPPSRIVELRNMLTMGDLENEDEYKEILEDTQSECGQFGQLVNVVIPKKNEVGATKVFLEYSNSQDAQRAIDGLSGRTFDNRKVEANFFDEDKFKRHDYS